MGATTFTTVAAGKTADDAYNAAVRDALYWHGHGGYTGTIAEKGGYVEFPLPARVTADRLVETVWRAEQEQWEAEGAARRGEKPAPTPNLALLEKWYGKATAARLLSATDDKWGPAVAVRLGKTEGDDHVPRTPTGKRKAGYAVYMFFGWASC